MKKRPLFWAESGSINKSLPNVFVSAFLDYYNGYHKLKGLNYKNVFRAA
jgi:hypothetical protein